MDNAVVQMIATAFGGFLAASGGFWIYLRKRFDANDASNQLLLGLAHYRIVELCMIYIQNGFVTKDEYDDLLLYFYEPYCRLGGNGSVERVMRLVQRLPLTFSQSDMSHIATAAKLRVKETDKPNETAEDLLKRKTEAEEKEDHRKRREDEEREC